MRIHFHTGGADFHPTRWQAEQIAAWLGASHQCHIHDGARAFTCLQAADLLVVMGLFWSGMEEYAPPNQDQREGLQRYVESGRPLIVHHGAIASYDDWPEFGELLGLQWVWGESGHGPVGEYRVDLNSSHPLTRGLDPFSLVDEAYYGLRQSPGFEPQVLATTTLEGKALPMVLCGQRPGRWVYVALGHDERAIAAPQMKTLWTNAVQWALGACD